MPRRKAADRGAAVQSRSRTGCNSCRARKVKCDEARPHCRNCLSRGLACDNRIQLKWEEEFVAQGRAFGREGVWSKERPPRPMRLCSSRRELTLSTTSACRATPLLIKPHHFINAFIRDLEYGAADQRRGGEESNDVSNEDATAGALVPNAQLRRRCGPVTTLPWSYGCQPPTLLPPPSIFTRFDGFDPSLLEYYLLRLCPLTTPSKNTMSPFADMIIPLFSAGGGQPFVLQAIMAFSARHRSLTDPRWTWLALSLKGRAVAALRQRLGLLGTRAQAIADPQIPVAMMFLCLDEILDNCDHRWVIHMRACQNWLRLRKQLPSSSRGLDAEHSLVSFAERFFAFQDVISRTACGKAPHFGLEYWERSLGRETGVQEWWMGCSTALANIIFRITELGRARDRKELSTGTFEMQAGSLEEELQSLTYKNHQAYDNLPGDSLLHNSFELMRESVTLYHHCLLYDASPSTPLVATSTRKILQMTQELMEAGSFSGLAFPLFVAAVELDPLNDELVLQRSVLDEERVSGRRFVLETLQALSGSSLFNVPKTRAVIRNIWTMRDLRLEEDQATSAHNDWNFYVSPYSSNISLA